MEPRRDVFQAIADPTRRQIINMIAYEKRNLNSIAENFDMSRSAVSQQIKILTECGLVVIEQQGRERFCQAKLDKLNEVYKWIDQYRVFWNKKLDALELVLNNDSSDSKKKISKSKITKNKKR